MAEGDNNTPEEQKQVTEEKRKQSNLLEDMNKALQKQVDYQARLRRMRGEELSDAQKTAMLYGEQAEVAERLFDFATLRKASFEEFNKTTKEYVELLDEEVEKGKSEKEKKREGGGRTYCMCICVLPPLLLLRLRLLFFHFFENAHKTESQTPMQQIKAIIDIFLSNTFFFRMMIML